MIENELLRDLARTYLDLEPELEFPDLMAVTFAQWVLEAGRTPSRLAREHSNFAGLKWRREMSPDAPGGSRGAARPVTFQAHDGRDEYCEFANLENFIHGYWRFISRSPYRGFERFGSDPEGYIRFLRDCGYSTDRNYVDKVMRILPEAESLLGDLRSEHGDGEMRRERPGRSRSGSRRRSSFEGIRIWGDLDGSVEEIRDGTVIDTMTTGGSIDELFEILKFTESNRYEVAGGERAGQTGGVIIPPEVPVGDEEDDGGGMGEIGDLGDLSIAIDVGHGRFKRRNRTGFDPGAVNERIDLREFDLNKIVATTAADVLEERGADVDVHVYEDPAKNLTLSQKGAKARGHDLFVSCHHNSAENTSAQGTETLLHERQDRRSEADEVFAAAVQQALADRLGLRDRTNGKGFGARALGVLTGANGLCTAKCLIEPFFISHSDLTVEDARNMAFDAGEALAEGIADYWLNKR